jgi:hypothetical protein
VVAHDAEVTGLLLRQLAVDRPATGRGPNVVVGRALDVRPFRTVSERVFSEVGLQELARICRSALRAVSFCTLDAGPAITRYRALKKNSISWMTLTLDRPLEAHLWRPVVQSDAREDQIAEGDKVVSRWTGRGTHQGELMGIPPAAIGRR